MNLINWPTEGDELRDSHEGGQYAYLVVPGRDEYAPSRADGGCFVDVAAVMTYPDVVLNHRDLWPPYSNYKVSPPDSDDCAAIVFAGSSHLSLWSEAQGAYWTAKQEDLTSQGRAVFDSLTAAFGVEPLIVTFLDT